MEHNKITIAVAEDHAVSRRGMIDFINEFGEFEVTIEANNGESLIQQIGQSKALPDICLLDVKMPHMNGYETAAFIKQKWPEIKILAISMYDNEQVIIKMIRNGAGGYILKESDPYVLREALTASYKNGYYYSEIVSGQLVNKIKEQKKLTKELSAREVEFLGYCCSDLKYSDIAAKMFVKKVDDYRDALFEKLSIKTRAGLVVYAMSMGLGK
jgi:DNA-binding NarL/FixJ family response regulator